MSTKTEIGNAALINLGATSLMTDIDTDDSVEASTLRAIFDTQRDVVLADAPWPFARKYAALRVIGSTADSAAKHDFALAYAYPSDCLRIRRITTEAGRRETHPPPFETGRDFEAPNAGDITMTLSAATWTAGSTITITASEDFFAETDPGNAIKLVVGSDEVTITIAAFSSATVVTGTATVLVAVALRATPITDWTELYDGRIIYADREDAIAEYTVQITDTEEFSADFVEALSWKLAAKAALALPRLKDMFTTATSMYEYFRVRALAGALNERQKNPPRDAEWIRNRTGEATSTPNVGDWQAFPDGLD